MSCEVKEVEEIVAVEVLEVVIPEPARAWLQLGFIPTISSQTRPSHSLEQPGMEDGETGQACQE